MMSIRQIYDIKISLASKTNLDRLQELLTEEGITSVVSGERSIRVDSPEGYDKISESVCNSIPKWYDAPIENPIYLVYDLLPLNNESCMLRL